MGFEHGRLELSLSSARADEIQYAYDELGRIVQASNITSGQAVIYTYDAVGNITSQTAISLSTLTISSFAPDHGPVGSQVTISGAGFSSTPSADIVKFNGVAAAVQTATLTQLVVTVPAGATSGTIGVQVGSNSVTSTAIFTVTASADGPTITGLYPTVGTAGSIITIAGTNFETVPQNNRVTFDTTPALVTTGSATSIGVVVPAAAGSGKVRLTTPRGVAISPTDFIIVPSGYSSTAIGPTGRLPVDGSANPVSLPTASKISLQLFDASAGDLLTIGATNVAISSTTLKVFRPDGSLLTSGAVTAAVPGLQLPKLTASGTYTIVVDPGSATGSLSLGVFKPIQAALTLDGTPTSITLTPPGRRAALSFAGVQGTFANVAIGSDTVPAGTLSVIAPNGAVLDSRAFTASGATVQPWLPSTGTYTVLIDPTGSVGGSLNVALTSSSSPTLNVNQGSSTVSVTNQTPVSTNFRGTAGQYLALAVSTTSSTIASGLSITVLGPDGTTTASGSMYTSYGSAGYSGSAVINMGPLQMAGTYTVVVQGYSTGSGTVTLTLSTPITATLVADGSTSGATISTAGQGVLYTVNAIAGQSLAFSLVESVNNLGRINAAAITVLRPDGLQLVSGTLSTTFVTCSTGSGSGTCLGTSGYYGSSVLNLPNVPESGTYTIVVQQTGTGQSDIGTLSATLSAPQTSGPTVDGGTYNAAISSPGQGLLYTFSGAKGEYLAFTVAESGGQIGSATIVVAAPDGSPVALGALTTNSVASGLTSLANSGSAVVNIGPLPVQGNYTVRVLQTGSGPNGTGTLAVTVSTPLTGTLAANASTSNIAISTPGRGLQYTFPATAGQYLALALTENVDQINAAKVTILQPDGTTLATGNLATTAIANPLAGIAGYSGSTIVNLGPLSTAGTYTVLVQQTGTGQADTGTLSLTLSGPLTGTLTSGSTSNAAVSNPGQAVQFSFAGTAGQVFAVTVSEHVDQIDAAKVSILKPDGTALISGNLVTTAVSNPLGGIAGYSGGVVVNSPPLPLTGTYSVLIQQTGAGKADTGSLSLTLSNPVAGSMAVGDSVGVPISLPGQGVQRTFSATAGQYITAQVSEAAGSSISGAAVTVFNPDGTRLKQQVMSATTCSTCNGYTGSTTINLGAVPQSGTYSILAQQTSLAAAGTGSLTVALNAETASTGSTSNISTSTAGQTTSFTFSAVAGQSMSVAMSGLVLTPSSAAYYATATVTNPDNSYLTYAYCYVQNNGCFIPLANLPQSGTYTVTVQPGGTATMSFTATVSTDVVGTLAVSTPVAVNLAAIGQIGLYQFTATTTQTYALTISGLTSTPANITYVFNVYNADGTSVASGSTTTATTLNLRNLPADTYTVSITPNGYPATASMQLILEPGELGSVPSDGTTQTFSTPGAGQNGYFTFQGTAGTGVTLGISSIVLTPSSAAYYAVVNLYNPDGSYLTYTYCYVQNTGCVLHLANLPQTGTYTVTVLPGGLATMTLTMEVSPDVLGSLVLGTTTNINLPLLGQSAVYSFTASPGQTLGLSMTEVSAVPANAPYLYSLYNSSGTQITNGSTSNTRILNLPNLVADTYTLLLTPQNAPSTATFQVTPQPGATGTIPTNAPSQTITTAAAGQIAYYSFSALAGQNVALGINALTLTPSSAAYYAVVNVYNPDGSYLNYVYCYVQNGGCVLGLRNLTQSGVYSVSISPGGTATMSLGATLSTDVQGTLTPSNTVNLVLGETGQNALYTFTATAGQTMALNVNSIVSSPASQSYTVYVYNSSGTTVASGSSTTDTTLNLTNLAQDTYTVLIAPQNPATATMRVTLEPGTTGAVPANGTSTAFSTPATHQNAYLNFTASAGQNLSLALSNLILTPSAAAYYVSVSIYNPDSSYLNSVTCYTSNPGCSLSLRNLPQTGTYSVVVQPGGDATMSFNATLSVDTSGTLAVGTPTNLNLGVAGQYGIYQFTATAGQTVAVNVAVTAASPTGTYFYFTIYNSAGTQVGSGSTQATTLVNLPNLPAGTYTLVIGPQFAATGTIQVTLEPGVTGQLPSDGTSSSYSTPAAGQYAYFKFTGTAGQSQSLAVSGFTTAPSSVSTTAYVYVYNPDGSYLGYTYCYVSSSGCVYSLRNPTQTGTYSVVIQPAGAATMSFNLTLSTDVTATLSAGTPVSLNLATIGQNALLTFTTTATQTVTFNVSSVSTLPAGQYMYAYVYNASGSNVGSTQTTGSSVATLTNLPAGTYSVLITPINPVTSSLQVQYQ